MTVISTHAEWVKSNKVWKCSVCHIVVHYGYYAKLISHTSAGTWHESRICEACKEGVNYAFSKSPLPNKPTK